MDETQEKLEQETEKWKRKLDQKLDDTDSSWDQMENVMAYRDDTEHFLDEEDYVRAFESIIYAWGILETLERLRKFE